MLLYLIPGAIALAGSFAYYIFKDRMFDKMLKHIAALFYIIAFLFGIYAVSKVSGVFMSNLSAVMSGEASLNFPFKPFICATIYIILATVIWNVGKKLETKEVKDEEDLK